MLPEAESLLGRSNFSIKLRAWVAREGLAARKIKALLLGSAMMVVL